MKLAPFQFCVLAFPALPLMLASCSAAYSPPVAVSCVESAEPGTSSLKLASSNNYDDGYGYSVLVDGEVVAQVTGRSAIHDGTIVTFFNDQEILIGKFWSGQGSMQAEHSVTAVPGDEVSVAFEAPDLPEVSVKCR